MHTVSQAALLLGQRGGAGRSGGGRGGRNLRCLGSRVLSESEGSEAKSGNSGEETHLAGGQEQIVYTGNKVEWNEASE